MSSSRVLQKWRQNKTAQTPRLWQALDQWVRKRMRAIQLKHWKRAKTIYPELLAR
jgi:hypothetical protein